MFHGFDLDSGCMEERKVEGNLVRLVGFCWMFVGLKSELCCQFDGIQSVSDGEQEILVVMKFCWAFCFRDWLNIIS